MSMKAIRDYYQVPAKRGGRVIYSDLVSEREGKITKSKGWLLWVRLEGEKQSRIIQPTDLRYVICD